MKFSKHLNADGSGTCKITPEDAEDMWHVYNLIEEEDVVKASTDRKVATGGSDATATERVRLSLRLRVERTDFDAISGTLRVKGVNVGENKFVKMGASHTLDLEHNRQFELEKARWDSTHLQRLAEASDMTRKAEIAAVLMDAGVAHICLVVGTMTVPRATVEVPIPKKRSMASGGVGTRERGLAVFFEKVLAALRAKVTLSSVKALILASPNIVHTDFKDYMLKEAADKDYRDVSGRGLPAAAAGGRAARCALV